LVDSDSVTSMSEARRLLQQGGVRLNDVALSDVKHALRLEDFVETEGQRVALVRFGRGKVLKLVLE